MRKRILSWVLCIAVLLTSMGFAPAVQAVEEDGTVIIVDD